jgi:hypothetical protein
VSFVAITLCVASLRVIPKISVYFVMTQSGNFLIHSRTPVIDRINGEPQQDGFLIRNNDIIRIHGVVFS